jgi:hypothetical protein
MRRVQYRKGQRGFTLVEAMFAAGLTITIVTTTLTLFVTGMMAWSRGEANIMSETGSHVAIRTIANTLRQAMSVTTDANGLGITYVLPLQANGTDVMPLTSDGITHRFELDGTTLNMVDNGVVTRTLCKGVILTDPLSANGSQAYVIFTPGPGSVPTTVTVEVANVYASWQGTTISARNRETVYLRNVPQISY